MSKKTNIIIPAITINDELLKCLKEINKIYYSSFFVTIVLNHDSKIKLPKYRYKRVGIFIPTKFFPLCLISILRFAVNQEYVLENIDFNIGDEIAVFPPVSGG